jgi:hypothetical protein
VKECFSGKSSALYIEKPHVASNTSFLCVHFSNVSKQEF